MEKQIFPCKCNDYIDDEGFGICRKRDKRFDGAFSCYVNQPSSCIDVYTKPNANEKQLSAVACEDKNQGTIKIV